MLDRTDAALAFIVRPALRDAVALTGHTRLHTQLAEKYLLSFGLQESRLLETIQRAANGRPLPTLARSLWQMEKSGGVRGVLTHASTAWFRQLLTEADWPLSEDALHYVLAYNQSLAAVAARALLWTDPQPLRDDEAYAWEYYMRVWRPGKPHPDTWPGFWQEAQLALEKNPLEGDDGGLAPLPAPAPAPEPSGPASGPFVLARDYAHAPHYWTGGMVLGSSSVELPVVDRRVSEARVFDSEEEIAFARQQWRGKLGEFATVPVDATA